MMQPFQAVFRPSRITCMAVVLLHVVAVVVCCQAFYGWMCWLGLILLIASFYFAWKKQRLCEKSAIRKIAIDAQGRAAVFVGSDETAFQASLRPGSMVTRKALFLQWETQGRRFSHCVLPDMTDDESYRRLQVWVQWGQSGN
ncbi:MULTISPECIES: protein YgfX [Neisseria]|nr:protein YgfX [Neisseria arctica]